MSKVIILKVLYNEYAAAVLEADKAHTAKPPLPPFIKIVEALVDYLEKREDLSLTDLRDQDWQAVNSLKGFGFFASGEVAHNHNPEYPGKDDNERSYAPYVSFAMDALRSNRSTEPPLAKKLQQFKPE